MCPRVNQRMECPECHYPFSEAAHALDLKIPHMNEIDLIIALQKEPGWFDYSGDCSVQAAYQLPNGMLLRVGITDVDEAPEEPFWVDIYEGLLSLKGSK